ncbi:MAG: DUF4149 domain-containing protein [Planctomycetota bacterium]
MNVPSPSRRLDLLAFLTTVCVGVWVGGGIVVGAVALPIVFDDSILPRDRAADFGVALFPRMNLFEGVLGAIAVLSCALLGRAGWGTARRHRIATGAVLTMTLIVVVFLLFLTPAIVAKIEKLRADGVDLSDRANMPPDRVALGRLHRIYAGLDLVKLIAGIAVLWLLATRRRR